MPWKQICTFMELYLPFNLIITVKSSSPEQIERPPFWPPYWRPGRKAWRHCALVQNARNLKISEDKMFECAVVGCTNRTPRDSKRGISFHRLPLKNKALLKEWLARIKRANLPKLSQCHVCSDHFKNSCFKSNYNLKLWPEKRRKRRLNEDAVPTKFPHQRITSKRPASERRRNKALPEEVSHTKKE